MRLYVYLILMFATVKFSFAQNESKSDSSGSFRIIRSNLGAGGSSNKVVTSKGVYYLSQSIGQSSPIGTSSNTNYSLLQGYQQPIYNIKVSPDFSTTNSLKATIYPNPFTQFVQIAFENEVSQDVFVLVFDVNGKKVFDKQFQPNQTLEFNLENLSSGSYLLKATTSNKIFNAKLIKN